MCGRTTTGYFAVFFIFCALILLFSYVSLTAPAERKHPAQRIRNIQLRTLKDASAHTSDVLRFFAPRAAMAAGATDSRVKDIAVVEKPAPAENMIPDDPAEESPESSKTAAIEKKKKGGKHALFAADSPTAASLQNTFLFSEHDKKRISIDFYKIDLHNVFRLFRQVSGHNLVVDEAVKGVLTLALDDVPWDFALDIILNLNDLEKTERFNTIVIYPKSKKFTWPQETVAEFDFGTDIGSAERESLVGRKTAVQPKKRMLSRELQRKAKIEEKNGNIEEAVRLYARAFELWPSNNRLSTRLAHLCLAELGLHARAIFYARKSLAIAPNDTSAALAAAISLANMKKLPEAAEYFIRSISDSPPMREALLNYAAFHESNDRPEAALKLLNKYHLYYGESVETMVAKARIYDTLELPQKAVLQYAMILDSGFPLEADLKRYIESRVAESGQ